jgi:hypothetical protein
MTVISMSTTAQPAHLTTAAPIAWRIEAMKIATTTAAAARASTASKK